MALDLTGNKQLGKKSINSTQDKLDERLFCAIKDNDVVLAGRIIANGANINAVKRHRIQIDCYQGLDNIGFNLHVVDYVNTLLYAALSGSGLRMLQLLLKKGANFNYSTDSGVTALHILVSKSKHSYIRELLRCNVNVDVHSEAIPTALHLACSDIDCEAIEILLGCKADVSIKDMNGYIPHKIVEMRCRKLKIADERSEPLQGLMVQLKELEKKAHLQDTIVQLQELGAGSPHTKIYNNITYAASCDNQHSSSLFEASANNKVERLKLLLQQGAKAHNTDHYKKRTPLQVAALKGHKEVVEVLIEHFKNISTTMDRDMYVASRLNYYNSDSETALHLASEGQHHGIYNLLLENGALDNIRNKFGKTARDIMHDKTQEIIRWPAVEIRADDSHLSTESNTPSYSLKELIAEAHSVSKLECNNP